MFGRIGDRIGRADANHCAGADDARYRRHRHCAGLRQHRDLPPRSLLHCFASCRDCSRAARHGGAVSLMTEFAPRGKRGLYGAWQSFTVVALGLLAGAGIVALLSALLTPEALHDWGWRIPFLPGAAHGRCCAVASRQHGGDTQLCAAAGQTGRRSGADIAATLRAIVMGIGRVMVWSAAGYTYLVIMSTYLQSALHTPSTRRC